MPRGVLSIIPQPLARLPEELLLGEDIEQMQRTEILALLEEGDGVGLAFGGDAGEELGVDYQALEVGEGFGERGEEAYGVAEGEELEGEGFDARGQGGDGEGLGEEGLVFVDFDIARQGEGAKSMGFWREVWYGEGLERDLEKVEVLVLVGGLTKGGERYLSALGLRWINGLAWQLGWIGRRHCDLFPCQRGGKQKESGRIVEERVQYLAILLQCRASSSLES